MSRPLRIDIPDGIYYVTSRALRRRTIVRDDQDRHKWITLLGQVAQRRGWRVFAWVLMDNHFQLFLRTPHADLSPGMHDLNSGYVTSFNHRHNRYGPLFQGRFKAIVVERDYLYWELSRYIHLNPVRARVVKQPERYSWSSCRFYFDTRAAPDWLAWEEVLCQHGQAIRVARREYKQFLLEGISSPQDSPLSDVVASTLLGSIDFIERMKSWLQDRLPDREVPHARVLRQEVLVQDIEDAVCDAFGVSSESLRLRGRHNNDARSAVVYLCRKLTRLPIEEIGARFGSVSCSAISHIVRRTTERRRSEKTLNAKLSAIERQLRNMREVKLSRKE